MSDSHSDDLGDCNGGAIIRTETRTGPPLDYIAHKLRDSLRAIHGLITAIKEYVPTNLPQPRVPIGTSYSVKEDLLLSNGYEAFHKAVVSYLALYNMLALVSNRGTFERLVDGSSEDLSRWLTTVALEGSLLG